VTTTKATCKISHFAFAALESDCVSFDSELGCAGCAHHQCRGKEAHPSDISHGLHKGCHPASGESHPEPQILKFVYSIGHDSQNMLCLLARLMTSRALNTSMLASCGVLQVYACHPASNSVSAHIVIADCRLAPAKLPGLLWLLVLAAPWCYFV